MATFVTLDTREVRAQFAAVAKDSMSLRALGAAAFRYPLERGFGEVVKAAPWPANDPDYAAAKEKKGQGTIPWVRTGKTLAALTNNAITQGKRGGFTAKKGLRFGVDRAKVAFVKPMTFAARGGEKGASLAKNDRVLMALSRGSKANRLAAHAAKRSGKAVAGPGPGTPARPLLSWQPGWLGFVQEDLEKAVALLMSDVGFEARVARAA